MKSLFEEMGGTYTEIDGIFYPNLALLEEDHRPIGIWGERHLRFLKEHRPGTYITLLTTCKLNGYLADINEQAEAMYDRLMVQMAQTEEITEQLKAEDQMEWVRRMNNLSERVREIVNAELSYV